jgi:hypothetical protein
MEPEPIHVYIAGREGDPRDPHELPDGVIAHYGPPLHPDDMDLVDGIPCTAVPRTLIDCAEILSRRASLSGSAEPLSG